MRKIFLSVLTIVVAGSLIAGGAIAFFTDVEESGSNTFGAGMIDIELSDGHGEELTGDIIDMTTAMPCDMFWFPFDIHLMPGSEPGPVYFHLKEVTCVENGVSDAEWKRYIELGVDPEEGINDLCRHVTFSLYEVDGPVPENWDYPPPAGGMSPPEKEAWIEEHGRVIIDQSDHMKLCDLECVIIPVGRLAPPEAKGPKENIYLVIDLHIQRDTGNEYQTDQCSVKLEVIMTQERAPAPEGGIILENKDENWNPILDDRIWGIAWYRRGSLSLDIDCYGLARNTPHQITLNSQPTPDGCPPPHIAMASGLAAQVYDSDNPGTAPGPLPANLYQRGYWLTGTSNQLADFTDWQTGCEGVLNIEDPADGDQHLLFYTNAHGELHVSVVVGGAGANFIPNGGYGGIKLLVKEVGGVSGGNPYGTSWTPVLMEKDVLMSFGIGPPPSS